jgi:folate-binding protein YgfZ
MNPASLSPAYQAARYQAATFHRPRGLIVVSGRDRASYLQGLFTNDIVALKTGQGCYTAYLTPQGRMIADLWVYELGDVILLTMSPAVKDTMLSKLDQFIFSEDVQLGDVSDTFVPVAVVGPESARAVTTAVGDSVVPDALVDGGCARGDFRGTPAILLRLMDAGEPGFELLVERAQQTALDEALVAAGAVGIDVETTEMLRIESGVPQFGVDMDEETIPLEAGIEARAISFSKGCYVGQEVIIRVLHRGHGRVARKLVGLVLDGDRAVAAGTELRFEDRAVGSVTSSIWSPALGRPVALGYLKRDQTMPGTRVSTPDGIGADVVVLPFTLRSSTS